MAAYNFLKTQGVPLPRFLRFRDTGFEMLPERWQHAAAGVRNLRLVDLLAEALNACDVKQVSSSQVTEAAEAYQSAVRAQAAIMPAAAETLSKARSFGYKIGLISNTMFTGEAHIDDLKRFGLVGYFDTMLFSADVNMWKPNAEPFLQVLDVLGVEPAAAVFVGDDSSVDVVGGHRVGMRTIHINSSSRVGQPDDVKPDARIDNLTEIFPILSRWGDEQV
jgi:putative hydrolase of the HAD superfamily